MATMVSDLTIDQLRELISDTVRESMGDVLEDLLAIKSENYVASIERARNDYNEGRLTPYEELFK